MRKRGIFAFVIYLLGTLFGGGLTLWAFLELERIESGTNDGWAAIGAAIIIAFGIMVGVPYLACLITKILQLATGLKLFGILCLILDVVVIGGLAYTFYTEGLGDDPIVMVVMMIPSALAFISNAIALKD